MKRDLRPLPIPSIIRSNLNHEPHTHLSLSKTISLRDRGSQEGTWREFKEPTFLCPVNTNNHALLVGQNLQTVVLHKRHANDRYKMVTRYCVRNEQRRLITPFLLEHSFYTQLELTSDFPTFHEISKIKNMSPHFNQISLVPRTKQPASNITSVYNICNRS